MTVPCCIIKREYQLHEMNWPVRVILLEVDDVSSWRSNHYEVENPSGLNEQYFTSLHKQLRVADSSIYAR